MHLSAGVATTHPLTNWVKPACELLLYAYIKLLE